MSNKSINDRINELNADVNKLYELLSLNSENEMKQKIIVVEDKLERMIQRLEINIEKLNNNYSSEINEKLDEISKIVDMRFNKIKTSESILDEILRSEIEESAYLKLIFNTLTSKQYKRSLKSVYEIIKALNE